MTETPEAACTPRPADTATEDGISLDDRLQAFTGLQPGPVHRGPDPVNQPMIRHWVEAMGDANPVYVDAAAARAAGFPGVIAPPTMLQAWIMVGLRTTRALDASRAAGEVTGDSPTDALMSLLDEAGFSSVVATNCEQHYERPLVLGDHLGVRSVIESVSPEKATALGVGHFITTRMDFTDQTGSPVATMQFRILKYRPRVEAPVGARPLRPLRPLRPRPALTEDNRFFFDGAKEGELRIQRCSACGTLRHPPRPACGVCRSFGWDTVCSSGRGTIYSFVVNHYPQAAAFDYPLVVALVELEEGTRLVASVAGFEPGEMAIGTPVVARFETFDSELTLPVFHPVPDASGTDTAEGEGRS